MKTSTIIVFLLVVPVIWPANASMTFDVNFESPTHTLGSSVTTGNSADTPTSGGFRIATVDQFPSQVALSQQPGTPLNLNTMKFRPDSAYNSGIHELSWDWSLLYTEEYYWDFTFTAWGMFQPTSPYTEITIVSLEREWNLGIVETGIVYSSLMVIDLDQDLYSFYTDGFTPIVGAVLPVDSVIEEFSVASGWSLAFDNFSWSVVPEPNTSLLVILGLALTMLKQKVSPTCASRAHRRRWL